jgi:hypothetical protein
MSETKTTPAASPAEVKAVAAWLKRMVANGMPADEADAAKLARVAAWMDARANAR